jgi:hypothetical protein
MRKNSLLLGGNSKEYFSLCQARGWCNRQEEKRAERTGLTQKGGLLLAENKSAHLSGTRFDSVRFSLLEIALSAPYVDLPVHVFGIVGDLSTRAHNSNVTTAVAARVQCQWPDMSDWNCGCVWRGRWSEEYASMTFGACRFSRASGPQWGVVGPRHNRGSRTVSVGKTVDGISIYSSRREIAMAIRAIASDRPRVVYRIGNQCPVSCRHSALRTKRDFSTGR